MQLLPADSFLYLDHDNLNYTIQEIDSFKLESGH